jgi:hypothetical protein
MTPSYIPCDLYRLSLSFLYQSDATDVKLVIFMEAKCLVGLHVNR